MKTNFASAAIAAAYLAINAQGKSFLHRFLNDTCEAEATAPMKMFDAQSQYGIESDVTNQQLYIKGRNERALCTDGDQIEIGLDNRAWV